MKRPLRGMKLCSALYGEMSLEPVRGLDWGCRSPRVLPRYAGEPSLLILMVIYSRWICASDGYQLVPGYQRDPFLLCYLG